MYSLDLLSSSGQTGSHSRQIWGDNVDCVVEGGPNAVAHICRFHIGLGIFPHQVLDAEDTHELQIHRFLDTNSKSGDIYLDQANLKGVFLPSRSLKPKFVAPIELKGCHGAVSGEAMRLQSPSRTIEGPLAQNLTRKTTMNRLPARKARRINSKRYPAHPLYTLLTS